jgi:hypothetical protein
LQRSKSILHLRIGITLRKFENVLEVHAAPRVNRLRVVSHHHQVAVIAGKEVNQVCLDFVRVLVFIDEDELKLPPIKFCGALVLLKQS